MYGSHIRSCVGNFAGARDRKIEKSPGGGSRARATGSPTSHRQAFEHFRSARLLDPQAAKEADISILLFRSASFGVGLQESTPEEVGAVITEILQSEDPKPEYVMESRERLLGVVHFVGIDVVAPYPE